MSTAAQLAANQANSKLSTGPKTEAVQAASSQNNFRHGLAGAFVLQSWENEQEYFELVQNLHAEHQPLTPTEILLVDNLAKHFWLSQRALRLQEFCFHETAPMITDGSEKEFTLYLRYQTTHERAFHKCLNDLLKLRAQQVNESRGFERQRRQQAEERRKQEMHEARLEAVKVKTELAKTKLPVKSATEVPAPALDIASPVREAFTPRHCAGSRNARLPRTRRLA